MFGLFYCNDIFTTFLTCFKGWNFINDFIQYHKIQQCHTRKMQQSWAMILINTTQLLKNDKEIISDVFGEENFETEEDKDSDVDLLLEPTFPQSGIVCQILKMLRSYMIFSDNREYIHICIYQINSNVEKKLAGKLKQTDFLYIIFWGYQLIMQQLSFITSLKYRNI